MKLKCFKGNLSILRNLYFIPSSGLCARDVTVHFPATDLKLLSTFKVTPIPNFIEVVFSSCKGETDH